MNYTQLRNIAVDGDIIFLHVNKKDILSRITSYFTKSIYTHAAFLFWYKHRLMLVESTTHGGIRIVQASVYADREFEVITAPKPWAAIEDRALSKSGTTDYGWFSAFYIGLREFLHTHFDVKIPVLVNNKNKACSEFVAEILDMDDTDVSPGKLHERLSS
jgi:hypothetical protein